LVIHHICGNRSCVNPEHLVAITEKEHRHIHGLSGVALTNSLADFCPKGHPLDGKNKTQRFCLVCKAEAQKKYVGNHLEKVKAYRKEYKKSHKEQTNASARARYKKDPAKFVEYFRQYKKRKEITI
jgi:hypothetical protein